MKTDHQTVCDPARSAGVPLEKFEYDTFTCSIQRAPICEAVTLHAGPQETPGEPHLSLWVRSLRHPGPSTPREIIVETGSLSRGLRVER